MLILGADDSKWFIKFLNKHKITRVYAFKDFIETGSDVACVGYSPKNNAYYGWSHRAWCSFKIGDVLKEGDLATQSGWIEEYLKEHPEQDTLLPVGFECKTLEDCKKAAFAYACSVS